MEQELELVFACLLSLVATLALQLKNRHPAHFQAAPLIAKFPNGVLSQIALTLAAFA
jgi:hypothetical protein